MMRVPLIVKGNNYTNDTLESWKQVWELVCQLSYENNNQISSIITEPSFMIVDSNSNDNFNALEHSTYYKKKIPDNEYEITLDFTWRKYSRIYIGSEYPFVNLQFERLHVPRCLFESPGIYQWFRYSFPNCKVSFWEE